ncbi:prepilin-type N-terminal cleavage/methylation domain-containing protein [Blautia sp. Sow4_E7]|uniref:prepilin-type N-terminal cleavage/methylation domain-containing protein n=1 Tax=Blautia sp. Sow4_E7 TaxID=3438749 RepID=UPI003F92E916
MQKNKNGFTLAELLVVVAIIAVLVAVSIPIFTSQLEKSREATDLANVRSAYAQVMSAAIVEDTNSPLYHKGRYQLIVPLKQTKNGWDMDKDKLVVGGIKYSDENWLNKDPRAKGRCKVYYSDSEGMAFLNWAGEDHINTESARDFLTQEILKEIVGDDYKYSVINSNETYEQGGGTKRFIDYAREHGFDLEDYGAATWQIYVKEKGAGSSDPILSHPAIYWSTVELTGDLVGKGIPVMGYRDGKYDVYFANVVTNNKGSKNQYYTIPNDFANITEKGGTATFQFDNYKDAKSAYDKIFEVYENKHTLTYEDMKSQGLTG